jgi:hypothetical protein
MAANATAARNLPRMIFRDETGKVSRSSYDPVLNSSEKSFMVMAGIIKEKIMGSSEKKPLISAWPYRKNVEKKNHPVSIRNMEMTIYAMGDIKYPLNSFLKILSVFVI